MPCRTRCSAQRVGAALATKKAIIEDSLLVEGASWYSLLS